MTRKDNKGRNLRPGESQRKDGMYQYRYVDFCNKRKTVYSWRLVRLDKTPQRKKPDVPLREKEAEIQEMLAKRLRYKGKEITLNEMFDEYLLRKKKKEKRKTSCGKNEIKL